MARTYQQQSPVSFPNLQECSQRQGDLENAARELRSEVSEAEKLAKKLSRELQLLEERQKALRERIGDLQAQNTESQMDPAHLARLDKQVQQFQKGVY